MISKAENQYLIQEEQRIADVRKYFENPNLQAGLDCDNIKNLRYRLPEENQEISEQNLCIALYLAGWRQAPWSPDCWVSPLQVGKGRRNA